MLISRTSAGTWIMPHSIALPPKAERLSREGIKGWLSVVIQGDRLVGSWASMRMTQLGCHSQNANDY